MPKKTLFKTPLALAIALFASQAQALDDRDLTTHVIDRAQIEASQAITINELLQRVVGAQLVLKGGQGSRAQLFLRGTPAMLLMNGHRMNSTMMSVIDPELVERIEINDGTINVLTRQAQELAHFGFKMGGGNHSTGDFALNLSGINEGTKFDLSSRLFETKGYDRSTDLSGSFADADKFRNKSGSASLSHDWERVSIGINTTHQEGKTALDLIDQTADELFQQTSGNVFVDVDFFDQWNSRIDVGAFRDRRDNSSYFTSKRYSADWSNRIQWLPSQQLVAGVDYANDLAYGPSVNRTERYNTGVYAENTSTFWVADLALSVRHDQNQTYGGHTTGKAKLGFDLPAQMRLSTSFGTAFRAPTMEELYGLYGNSNLQSETAHALDVELTGTFGSRGTWGVSLYQNEVDNLINDAGLRMENIADARIQGVELSVNTNLWGWMLDVNASYINPENQTGVNAGKTIVGRATQLFAINLDRQFERFSIGATYRGQNGAWASVDNADQYLPSFTTLDLRAGWRMSNQFETRIKAVNVLNKSYGTQYGYLDEPRGLMASIVWTPDLSH